MPEPGKPEGERDRGLYWERDVIKRMAALESFRDIWGTKLAGFIDDQDRRHKETQDSIKELADEVGSLKSVRDKMLGLAFLWPIVVVVLGGLALNYFTPKAAAQIHPETQTSIVPDGSGHELFCTWSNAGEARPYCVPIQAGEKK